MYTYIGDDMKKFEISENNYRMSNILVMNYSPKIRKCSINNRIKSSLLFVEEGTYRYSFDSTSFVAKSGDVIYLPQSASYAYEVLSETTFCIQAEFNLYCEKNGKEEVLLFSDCPIVFKSSEAKHLFTKLSDTYFKSDFMTISVIYEMLAVFFGHSDSENYGSTLRKIKPATDYIKQNLCTPVYISKLAEICGISAVHLRRLFKSALGVSPVKYRNTLLMRYACELLISGGMNVSETSDILGFPDIYTFSQSFKKEVGVSPKKYADNSK